MKTRIPLHGWLASSLCALASVAGADPAATRVLAPVVAAAGSLEFDLGELPAGARIVRATLRPGRVEPEALEMRLEPVEVAAGGETLRLRPPRFDAFDATEVVRGALAGGRARVRFEIRSLPGHRPAGGRLEVTGAFAPREGLASVRGLQVEHRAGRTYLVWRGVDPGPSGPQITYGAWKAARTAAGAIRYRIYRSDSPIDAGSILEAELVDEVEPLSGWNAGRPGAQPRPEAPLARYVVDEAEGPLPGGAEVYVHAPADRGRAWYAVAAATEGEEDLTAIAGAAAGPVEEAPGPGEPVLQRTRRPAEPFHYVRGATVHEYVRWESPPFANRPSTPHDYLVALPARLERPAKVGLHLHAWGGSLEGGWGWWYEAADGAILVSTNQDPYDWWTGYHEGLGTWRSWRDGTVRPYTQRRLLSFLDWVATRWEIDPARVFVAGSSMGGSGAPCLALRFPDRFAFAVSWVGVHDPARSPQFRGSYEKAWGRVEWGLEAEGTGRPAFEHYSDVAWIRLDPSRDAPLVVFSNGTNDDGIGWEQALDFWRALQESRQPHVFLWGRAGHGQRTRFPGPRIDERELSLDVAAGRTIPAFTRSTLDGDPAADPEGQSNLYLYWDDAPIRTVDEPERWAMTIHLHRDAPEPRATVDVTPRRCQRFRPRPGQRFRWTSLAPGGRSRSGEVVADRWGLVTVPSVEIDRGGCRIEIVASP